MAFIAPLAGAAVGGGLLGSIVTTAVGIGINLAIAYFFPQKIKGPRAESLKAQTSRYGEQLTRWYGSIRTAGAVIWLKGNHVDEHVRTERQGKALGPEVTTYSYTATFAVAFAWNGPASGITRIWADDKLIFDVSFEALQNAIDNGGKGIGVAKGASITLYLGTDDQQPDPDIEADRGAGQVPAWPGIVYAVIKNLPLDEFGIRVPNIEAEITQAQNLATTSVAPTTAFAGVSINTTDFFGDYFANAGGTTLYIERLPTADIIAVNTLPYDAMCVHITALNKVAVTYQGQPGMRIFDAATGAFESDISGVGPATPVIWTSMTDISFGGVNYLFVHGSGGTLTMLSNIGTGYDVVWSFELGGTYETKSLSASASKLYGCTDWVFSPSKDIVVIDWDSVAPLPSKITLSALDTYARACFYDVESDSVIIETVNGSLYVYTPDLGTLLRSKTNSASVSYTDPLLSNRMKVASDQIGIKFSNNDIYIYRVSDLGLVQHIVAHDTSWANKDASQYYLTGFNERWQTILTIGTDRPTELWYLPRAQRQAVPLADVLAAECRLAGLEADVSEIDAMIYGYGDRSATPPRGVIEDLTRVNFVDFAQVDGLQAFFPRQTSAFRTIALEETGMALNAEPDPVLITEEYPDALDMPEQMIITYPSYDAAYRTGAQAGNTKDDRKFNDEPSQADETGAPLKVRRNRTMEFSTAQVLKDDDAAKVADILFNALRDAAIVYKTNVGPKHMDLHPGLVVNVPLDESRTAKAVVTKMSGDQVIELEMRKRGDSFVSEAVGQPTPYVIDTLLGPADLTPVLIDGHLLRSADDNDGFYAGVAVISHGNFRSASIYRSTDGGYTYSPWAGLTNGLIRGIALDALPDRPHPGAWDRATTFNIAVPVGTAPDSVTEEALLASETTNGFAVRNPSGEWEYIRAASVVDNMDGTWTLSTLLRGLKGTEFAMSGHVAGATVIHLDDQAMTRPAVGDRTLSRIYVAVPTSTVFDSTGAVTFTNQGKGLRPWSPVLASAVLDAGTGDWTLTWHRRDRLGESWPESGPEDPAMSETTESYVINIYDGMGVFVNDYTSSSQTFTYTAADQNTDFGSPQTSLEFGVAQVSATYGDGIEMREAA
ncbi:MULTISPECIES: phage tail protein [unclassified Mesorhizobium]|uniref:GTA baseplate fiber-binding domain-containing protein n=2 Tax=Mesorhizobium TaxID=68287 RepID=UPI000FDC49D8|nr:MULTISPECIES: phage tail protein [unclassified Mesorhizobium]TGT76704.1 hypothetical protein EN809_003615 [Mesorhizobium sp. M2E.F.Ca.ET.166.01.1.1]TGW02816.1 hypothetical protein EN797_003615 [Mesorhizobium sp. M2E.F.Ca.ET.154.01.1.1]